MKLVKFGIDRRGEAAMRELNEMRATPVWQALRTDVDKANVAKRAELKQRLDAIPELFAAQIEQAGEKHMAQVHALDELRKNMQVQIREAEEAIVVARSAVWTLEQKRNKEEFDIKRELYDSRDMRIDEYFEHLSEAYGMIRHFVRTWPRLVGYRYGSTPIYAEESNAKEVQRALDLIKDSHKKLEEMALLPLSRAEVDERLNAISSDVARAFRSFSYPYPVLNADGEVELTTPRLRTYYALQAAGAATNDDTQQMHVLAAGGSVLGERGARRVRNARASMINA
ncbi:MULTISPECIES: hypothetical protein, partial [unclassified Burkholderia]|uniref:hypothetical protein n=1 Tax=unclassified Burkholderia TaxID=2613784 RepID=UPI002ABD3BB9